jgi:hypothetical protein
VDPLERRIEEALGALPDPDDETSARVRRSSLAALPPYGRERSRRLTLLLAAALTAGAAAGAGVAAIGGALSDDTSERVVSPRPPTVEAPPVGKIAPPPEGRGVAALVDGRLWVATRSASLEGAPATAAGLSPNLRNLAVGEGASLVLMAPDGRRIRTIEAPGGVGHPVWAPLPIRIAYLVATKTGNELWLVEGDGDFPRRVVTGVAWVKPSWRPDSEAVAYVARSGRVNVYDTATGDSRPAGPQSCFEGTSAQRSPGRAFEVAFSPSGGQGARIAYVTGRREVVVSGAGARGGGCDAQPPIWALTGLAWISAADLVVANRPAPGILAPNSYLWRYRATDDGPEELGNASIGTGAVVLDVAAAADDRMLLAVAGDPRRHSAGLGPRVMPPSRLEVWWVRVPPERGTVPRVHSRGTLLRLEGRAARRALTSGAVEIAWR